MAFKAAHGVEGDDAAGQFQAAQELGHGGDFVALLCGAQLAEHEPVARGPRADQMDWAAARPATAAQGLAVEGDDFAGQRHAQALRPGGEGLGELRRIQRGEDPPEGVVAGDAMRQCEQSLQPVTLRMAELFHVHEALGTAEQRADRDDQDVVERMAFGARDARVFKLLEVVADAGGLGHPEFLPTQSSKVHL